MELPGLLTGIGIIAGLAGASTYYLNVNMEESPLKYITILEIGVVAAGSFVHLSKVYASSNNQNQNPQNPPSNQPRNPPGKLEEEVIESIDEHGRPVKTSKKYMT